MKKDYSKMSKVIVKYIMTKKIDDMLSQKQVNALESLLPKEILNKDECSLFKNTLITGSDNKLYKLNYNPKSIWFSPLNWQRQMRWISNELGFKYDKNKSDKENFKNIINEIGLDPYVNLLIFQINSVDFFTVIDKNIKKINTYSTKDFYFDIETIESDLIETIDEKNTWYIKINGKKLIQVQVPASKSRPHSHLARINLNKLVDFIKEVKTNNETWGISVEVAICKKFNIDIPSEYTNRYNDRMVNEAVDTISELDGTDEYINFTKSMGAFRTGSKKSSTDFMAENEKISVKSNFNSNTFVCPPNIGQPGIANGINIYNKIFGNNKINIKNFFDNNMLEFKKEFQKNIVKIVENQIKNLFSEDKILYLRKMKRRIKMMVVDTKNKEYEFKKEDFLFSRSPQDWNESVSIQYQNISIANMQLHTNRSPFKFRFNFENLLLIIKSMQN